MKKLTILSGAGISAESGIKTFRDSDGLWENHNVTDVASPEGWQKDRELVLEFYNQRRRQLHEVEPNNAHKLIADLEKHFDVQIVTQNIDDLHERAGSTNILHIHGELFKSCSCNDKSLVYEQKSDINLGDKAEDGAQLRPFIVWFGHSSYYIQVDNLKILVDPVFSGSAAPFSFMVKSFNGADLYSVDDMPELDVLLITHDHFDHLDFKTVKSKKKITYFSAGKNAKDLINYKNSLYDRIFCL